ncbi:MAG TPA: hypothetical protein VIL20_19415, partial [Sandaracinaceae bacterium]
LAIAAPTQSGFSSAAPATSATADSSAVAVSIATRQKAAPTAHHVLRFNVRIVQFLRSTDSIPPLD